MIKTGCALAKAGAYPYCLTSLMCNATLANALRISKVPNHSFAR